MANFKLRLIVPNNDESFNGNKIDKEAYIASLITNFTDQLDSYQSNQNKLALDSSILHTNDFNYTYNEKVSFHKNGQKELTFTMDDKIFINNEYIQNPYARILRVGVQIELTDKYNNIHLFTVNKVQYGLHNLNITYNVTCQDSFTYQLNRQNSGYTLSNDETSVDFIGALDIDQWAEKITTDCYVTYRYIPLDTGIYQYIKNGIYYIGTFEVPGDDVVLSVSPQLENVSKIIKAIYNKNNYPDYYETFPFSASGSSANAALISAAETLGLQLFTVEGYSEETTTGKVVYNRFFYFGPTKNPDVSGLTYSPKQEIQNFGLNFSGDSLTTVLNVKSTTWEDEEIGIFPKMPHIIQSIIMENNWSRSLYYPGFFLEKVKGDFISDPKFLKTNSLTQSDSHKVVLVDGELQIDDSQESTGTVYFFVDIDNTILPEWPTFYNKLVLHWDDEHYTSVTTGGEKVYTIYGDRNNFLLYFSYTVSVYDPDSGTYVNKTDSKFFHLNEEIDKTFLNVYNTRTDERYSNFKCALCVKGEEDVDTPIVDIITFYAGLTRNYTEEEINFAMIAEECPWLENKLINFSYFYNQGILSKAEYESLMSWLQNDLRIINGQLMCYSAAYLQGLHDQVKILSNIENSADVLGAEFNASVTVPYQDTGDIKPSIDRFTQEYNVLFHQNNLTGQKTPLINLNKLISQKFNQYIAAEQRFFKNIYNFDQYFNDINIYAKTSSFTYLDDVRYTLDNNKHYKLLNGDSVIFSFSDVVNYKSFNKDSPIIEGVEEEGGVKDYTNAYSVQDLYIKENGKYIKTKIPNSKTFTEFYVPSIVQDNLTQLTEAHQYNDKNKYFLDKQSYQTIFLKTDNQIARRNLVQQGEQEYVSLTLNELKALMIGREQPVNQTVDPQNPYKTYYIRNVDKKILFDWVRCNSEVITSAINQKIWSGWNWVKTLNPSAAKVADNLSWSYAWSLYKIMMPIDNLYIKDYNIQCTEESSNNILYIPSIDHAFLIFPQAPTFSWKIYDENGKAYNLNNLPSELYQQYYPVPYLTVSDGLREEILNANNDATVSFGMFSWFLQHNNDFSTKYYALSEPWEIRQIRKMQASGGLSWFFGQIGAFFSGAIWGPTKLEWRLNGYTQYSKSILHKGSNNFDNVLNQEKQISNLVYVDDDASETAKGYLGDSIWPNYVVATDSDWYSKYYSYAWYNSNLFSTIDGDVSHYKHYFNYYKYIIATYSQGVLFEHNNNQDLLDLYNTDSYTKGYAKDLYYINNKYGRFCTKDSILNTAETYYLVDASESFEAEGSEEVEWLIKPNSENTSPAVGNRFSTIKFYPITENQEPVTFSDIFSSDFLRGTNKITGEMFTSVLTEKIKETTLPEGASDSDVYMMWDKDRDGGSQNPYLIYCQTKVDGTYYGKYCYLIHNEPWEQQKLVWEKKGFEGIHNQQAYLGSFVGLCYEENNDNAYDAKDLIVAPYSETKTLDIDKYIKVLKDANKTIVEFSTSRIIEKNTYVYTLDGENVDALYYYSKENKQFDSLASFEAEASQINLTINPQIYFIPAEDENLMLVSDLSEEVQQEYWSGEDALETHWYSSNDLKTRTYSINQIISGKSSYTYYYLDNSTWATSEIIDNKDTFVQSILVKWYTYYTDEKDTLIINSKINEYNVDIKLTDFNIHGELDLADKLPIVFYEVDSDENDSELSNDTNYSDSSDEGYMLLKLTRTIINSWDITSMTNGEFWYYFKNRLDISDIMQKAAIIETQLTTYWQQAYTAAHHCKWFLPEYWQTTSTDKADNKFSQWLYLFNGSKIKLNYDFIPKVKIFDIEGQTLLPNYQYIYTTEEDLQDFKDAAAITELEVIQNNPTVLETINHFFGVDNHLFAQEYGRTTYYLHEGGGWEWSNVAHILEPNNKVFDYFEGLYGMQLHLLLKNYVNAATTLYEKTLKQKLNIWKMLYSRYPGIFLENTYENADARSSEQLLKMAKLAFKDYTSPEKQYNITLIDAAALQGYNGQELHLGDGILIRTSDYYDAIDETYRALNQYLFISDINYELRKDTDIALTVNAIKYQDKLLQSIVKLIR